MKNKFIKLLFSSLLLMLFFLSLGVSNKALAAGGSPCNSSSSPQYGCASQTSGSTGGTGSAVCGYSFCDNTGVAYASYGVTSVGNVGDCTYHSWNGGANVCGTPYADHYWSDSCDKTYAQRVSTGAGASVPPRCVPWAPKNATCNPDSTGYTLKWDSIPHTTFMVYNGTALLKNIASSTSATTTYRSTNLSIKTYIVYSSSRVDSSGKPTGNKFSVTCTAPTPTPTTTPTTPACGALTANPTSVSVNGTSNLSISCTGTTSNTTYTWTSSTCGTIPPSTSPTSTVTWTAPATGPASCPVSVNVCNGTNCAPGSVTIPVTIPDCNATPTPTSACVATTSNTCGTGNGTQTAQYTTHNGSTMCNHVNITQTCTVSSCDAGNVCTNGQCPTPTPTPTPTPNQCANLVTNGGFEDGSGTTATGWTTSVTDPLSRVSGAHSGSWAAEGILGSLSNGSIKELVQNGITLQPNTTYTISGYVKTILGQGHIQFDTTNTGFQDLVSTPQDSSNSNASWEYLSKTFTVGSTPDTIVITLLANSSTNSGGNYDVLFDDISLTTNSSCPTPTPTPVCSGTTPDSCNGVCTNTQADSSNCGTCGNACAAGLVCTAGKCGLIPGHTYLSLRIGMDAIGSVGDNENPNPSSSNKTPGHTNRNLAVEIFDSNNSQVFSQIGSINYNAASGVFLGMVDLGANFANGNYTIKVKSDGHLKRLIPGIQNISSSLAQPIVLPGVNLVAGDIDANGNSNNALTISDYNILLSCVTSPFIANIDNHALCNSNGDYLRLSDLEDNGVVDQFDYNLFLREYSVQNGD